MPRRAEPDRCARGPAQLLAAEISQSASLQVLYIVQADEMHALLVEAVIAFNSTVGEAFEEGLTVVNQDVVLTRQVMNVEYGTLDDLLGGVELSSAQ